MKIPARYWVVIPLLMSPLLSAVGSPGDLDSSFDPGSGIDSSVCSVCVQPDGKLIVAGQFTTVAGLIRHELARLNPDGSGDPSFNADDGLGDFTGPSAYGFSTTLQPDGKVLIAGNFTRVDGIKRNSFARLNSDGTLDTNFNVNALTFGFAGLQSNGKIVVGSAYRGLARLDADGKLDNTFHAGAGTSLSALVVQPDDKILAYGSYDVIRANADGTVDTNFQPIRAYIGTIYAVAVQPDGKILVGGGVDTGSLRFQLARFNADGTLDPTFHQGTNFDQVVRSIALQSDGKILVSGQFQHVNGIARNGLVRLNPDGSLDASFNANIVFNGNDVVFATSQPDDKILIYGVFGTIAGHFRNYLARLNPDGTVDTSFNPSSGIARAHSYPTAAVLPLRNGQFLSSGIWETNGRVIQGVARVNADGQLDSSFQPVGLPCSLMVQQSDDKVAMVVVTNTGPNPYTVAYEQIQRINADGTPDDTFTPAIVGPGAGALVHELVLQPDGKLLIDGNFGQVNGIAQKGLARLNTDGTLDSTFHPMLRAATQSQAVEQMEVQTDGKILVNGFIWGPPAFSDFFLRLNSDGTIDSSFVSTKDLGVLGHFALQPNGKILISNTRSVARLNQDGTDDPGFRPLDSTYDWPFAIQPDGKILIGHTFANAQNPPEYQSQIVRFNANGTPDPSFDPIEATNASGFGTVIDLKLLQDSKILLRGFFSSADGVPRWELARFLGDAPVILTQPIGHTNTVGKPVSFTVVASGATPLNYQWLKNGRRLTDNALISGAKTATLTIKHARFSDSAPYSITVSNASGSVTSDLVRLRVQLPNGGAPGGPTGKIRSLQRLSNGHIQLQFPPGTTQSYLVEASTNLQNWNVIGVWNPSADGSSNFEDDQAPALSARFYRIVPP